MLPQELCIAFFMTELWCMDQIQRKEKKYFIFNNSPAFKNKSVQLQRLVDFLLVTNTLFLKHIHKSQTHPKDMVVCFCILLWIKLGTIYSSYIAS